MPLLDQLADRVSAAFWNLHPSWAVRLGRHEYDGVVPDLSAEALADGYERLGRLRGQVAALTDLSAGQELDRAALLAALDGEILAGEIRRDWARRPAAYLEPLDVGPYLGRDYAPVGLRLERAVAVLETAPAVLAAARANLDPVLPAAAVDWARRRAGALAGALSAGPAAGGEADPEEERWLQAAGALAAAEVEAFAAWLEAERLPRADESHALGGEALAEMLRVEEALERPLPEIAALASRTLAADRAAAEEAAGDGRGRSGEPTVLGEGWAAAVEAAAERARRYAIEVGLGGFLDEMPLLVRDGTSPAGEEVALDPPGPYDDPAAGAVLYAGRPGREPGEADDLAVAAAHPGRLLQSRRAAAGPTEVSRRFSSRGLREGWALYAGEAMWEAGYRGGSPAWRRTWLSRAQRAGCRLVCAVGLHTGEMSREQAEAFFMEQIRGSGEAARLEVEWVAADPGSMAAGLGRLELLDLRQRWEERFPERSRGDFHDGVLSRGAPPLGLLGRVVLP